jgi:hypothetical protein
MGRLPDRDHLVDRRHIPKRMTANLTLLDRNACAGAGGARDFAPVLVRVRPNRLIIPLIVIGLSALVIAANDASFLGGVRPFDGGDDGLFTMASDA